MARTVIHDIPAESVDDEVDKLHRAGATNIEKTQQADGNFTLTFNYEESGQQGERSSDDALKDDEPY
jgi:hypothetical protein